jgi:uncharacterized protein YbjT (DUF2867 family)
MKKVILFGATGNLGQEIAKELVRQGYELTVAVRNEKKASALSQLTTRYIIADACSKNSLKGICDGHEIVVSALGKSVSPNDKSKPGFREVDLEGNRNILEEAIKSGVKKFVYVSAYQSENYLQLEYFRVHHEFSELLKKSGIDYSIIKPPAIFSAFIDMIDMAKKGRLINIGPGDRKTNPIYEGDLAKVCVDSIREHNKTIEAGGKTIYTRGQLNEIIQQQADKSKKVRSVPLVIFRMLLPVIKIFNRNMFDKFAFFTEVMKHDTIAPQVGETKFEDYIRQKIKGDG